MSLYSGQISQLLQGVSQQPPHTRAEGQLGEQINCLSDIVNGLRRRSGTKVIDEIVAGSFVFDKTMAYHFYDRGDGESYLMMVDDNGLIKVVDLTDGSEPTYTAGSNVTTYLAHGSRTPYEKLKFHTIADTTFIANSDKEVTMYSGTTPPGYDKWLIYCKRANYGHEYTVTITDPSAGTSTYTVSTPATVAITTTSANKQVTLSTKDIINRAGAKTGFTGLGLYDQINAAAGSDGVDTIAVQNDIIYLTSNTIDSIQVEDGNHGLDLFVVKDTVNNFADLPLAAPGQYFINVKGQGESKWDDYWVQWIPDNDSSEWYGPGVWQECAKPYEQEQLFETSMPIKVVRDAAGDFDSSIETGWGKREAGDVDTNPAPSFVGSTITGIGSYQNRLYMLTEENVVMSRAFDQLQFFAESVAAPSDDDPVDSASSDNQVTDLTHAVIFNKDFVAFSNSAQFVHDGTITVTPSTFGVSTSSKFNATPALAPVVAGRSILFPDISASGYVSVWEYRLDTISGDPVAENTTKHLPRYIDATPYKMFSDTSAGLAVIHADDALWIMQYYDKDGKRSQMAWHKWTHATYGDTNHKLYAAGILAGKLYLLVQYDTGEVYLESMELDNIESTENSDFEIFLDGIYSDQVATGSWTVDTIDYNCRVPIRQDLDNTILVQGTDCDNPGFAITAYGDDGSYYYMNQTSTTGYIIQGLSYKSSGELTNPYVRDSQGRPFLLHTVIDQVTFNLVQSSYIDVIIEHAAADDYTHTFDGQVVGSYQYNLGSVTLQDIEEIVPVRDVRQLATIKFESEHHLGFNITSMSWLCRMAARGRRSQ
jgi:hypothetical protein